MTLKGLFLLMILLGGFWASHRIYDNVYVENIAAENYNGITFMNANGKRESPSYFQMARWILTRKVGPWPEKQIEEIPMIPAKKIGENHARVTWIGQGTFLIQLEGKNILTDPHWGEHASVMSWIGPKRMRAPGVDFSDLPKIDYILLSHNHYGHFDQKTLEKLIDAYDPQIVTFYGNDTLIKSFRPKARLTAIGWWGKIDAMTEASQLKFIGCPARHWSGRGLLDHDKTLWGGFMIQSPQYRIFFAGNTGYNSGRHFRQVREKLGIPNIALLPIGGAEPRWLWRHVNMSPVEAVQAHQDLQADLSLATSYDTFSDLGDEAYGQAPADLSIAMAKENVPPHQFLALKPGDHVELPGHSAFTEDTPPPKVGTEKIKTPFEAWHQGKVKPRV